MHNHLNVYRLATLKITCMIPVPGYRFIGVYMPRMKDTSCYGFPKCFIHLFTPADIFIFYVPEFKGKGMGVLENTEEAYIF